MDLTVNSSNPAPGSDAGRGQLRRWWPVAALFLLFAAPMIAAYLWQPGPDTASTNYGQLVDPARPITGVALRDLEGRPVDFASLAGKWTLLYFGAKDCDDICSKNLYKIERVRLTQNKNIRRVQGVYIVPATLSPQAVRERVSKYAGITGLQATADTELGVLRFFEAGGHGPIHERIYIIDPLGNLMMSYPASADPTGMRKDLARLLKASQIG